ncbi:MAG: GTP pyrophosphokinase [Limisphaerales bacterium]
MKRTSKSDLNELLERAIEIAMEAHRGQKDKNGQPYILHPLRMMMRASKAEEKMVAVLHDVVEDSDWTLKDLKKEGFPRAVIEAVDHLTKREGEEYDDFVTRAASHPVARAVKLLDLEDNMNVLRFKKVDEKTLEKLSKYFNAWHRITG